ncbi:MAG: 2-dehydro-3-deoxy-D-gluconate 5-dehydrogenase KduD [Saprospiraceae bacterium]|nr:2-dehydro-3-deoxy-D-gluconate 5-dehydrogenase KduD [Saprospiraceae bacterium]
MFITDTFDLTGKTALVTGASRGLGQAMAIGLAEAGADLILVDREICETTQHLAKELGRKAMQIQLDLAELDSAGAAKIIYDAAGVSGRLDILVNNAGVILRKPTVEVSEQDWNNVIDVNLNATFFLCQAMGKYLLQASRPGKIINIASMLSYQGGLMVPSYTATKSAVAGLTRALANEWAANKINVNGLAPGYFSTEVTLGIRNDAKRNEATINRIPASRWGRPDDLKGAIVFLASDASHYLHGTILAVDGGWLGR